MPLNTCHIFKTLFMCYIMNIFLVHATYFQYIIIIFVIHSPIFLIQIKVTVPTVIERSEKTDTLVPSSPTRSHNLALL